jgi:beta-phosphoglucomutase-like phosphatase (HAD superfamily)
MPDVLLTDIDGTPVDSNALHAEAWRRTFEHFGIQIGLDEAWRQIGKGGDKVIPIFVPKADRKRLEKPLKDFRNEIFHRDGMPRMVTFYQVRMLLLRVRGSGMKIVLATPSEKGDLYIYGKLVGMEDLVDEVFSSADAKSSKPDADIFAVALQKSEYAARTGGCSR